MSKRLKQRVFFNDHLASGEMMLFRYMDYLAQKADFLLFFYASASAGDFFSQPSRHACHRILFITEIRRSPKLFVR